MTRITETLVPAAPTRHHPSRNIDERAFSQTTETTEKRLPAEAMQSDDRPTGVTLGDRHNACHARFMPPSQYVSRCEFDPRRSILFSARRTKPAESPRSKPYTVATARIRVAFPKHKDDITRAYVDVHATYARPLHPRLDNTPGH